METASPAASAPDDLPWIISVDDHVTEPPDLWTTRLSAKLRDRGPQVRRDRIRLSADAREMGLHIGDEDGRVADYWIYEGKPMAGGILSTISHAVGFEGKKLGNLALTYDEVCPGAWRQSERLADMTTNHVEASLCFSNAVSGYCGQLYLAQPDKALGMACIRAYNDWMIDDWCAGAGRGRLIPLILIPLWDPVLAASEVRRCAAKSACAVSFCENPHDLGLPSIYGGAWEPLLEACAETGANISMHIGSAGKIPTTAPDAPYMITSVLMFVDSMTSMLDFVLAGVFERFPKLKISYSEGQIGWLPYAIRRADKVWLAKDKEGRGYQRTPNPPSSYIKDHVYGCIFDDDTALLCRELIGVDQIMLEVDYPHSACAFPNVAEVARELSRTARLNEEEQHKVLRGNAIKAYGLERLGIRP
jgi:predicted TIM-barrel fold metal-dependent hydrolase